MFRDLRTSLVILLVSSGVAIAANLLRTKPLSWVREKLPKAASPTVSNPTTTVADTATAPTALRSGVVTIHNILQHLAAGTATFVDAREAHEYAEGHLKGALNMPSSAAFKAGEALAGMVPPDAKIVVYCGGGQCEASHNVLDALQRDFGFTDVSIYEKGWEEISASPQLAEWVVKGDQP